MKLNKFKASSFGQSYEAMELTCTTEEYEMLREFLLDAGVVLCKSQSNLKECTVYVRNPYQSAVGGWGSDLCKKMAKELFERLKVKGF